MDAGIRFYGENGNDTELITNFAFDLSPFLRIFAIKL